MCWTCLSRLRSDLGWPCCKSSGQWLGFYIVCSALLANPPARLVAPVQGDHLVQEVDFLE
jgi:hypothetical protein